MEKCRKIAELSKGGNYLSTVRNRSFSVICLCILVFYLIRPVLPYVEYAVNKEYISKNLCANKDKPHNYCEGKCYLEKQLTKSSDPLESNNDHNKKNILVQKMEDHLKADGILAKPFEKVSVMITHNSPLIIELFFSPIFIPPRF